MASWTLGALAPLAHALATACLSVFAPAQARDQAAVLEAIQKHFEATAPELTRYQGVVIYGETTAAMKPDGEALHREESLFADAAATPLLATMPRELRMLGHNLLVHAGKGGAEYLAALHTVANSGGRARQKEIGGDLFCATIAAGEPGEQCIVAQLDAESTEQRAFWAAFLAARAIYRSSAAPVEARLAKETDPRVQALLLRALASIGMPSSVAAVRTALERTKDDHVQAAGLFTLVELLGFDAVADVDRSEPIGEEARQERDAAKEWLAQETSAQNKHGREVGNDSEFVARFADLDSCPTIRWLAAEKLLEGDAVEKPQPLDAERRKHLLELLLESRGFGLEAIKGALFLSVTKDDEAMLLRIRASGFFAPNSLSGDRARSLELMVRHVRQS